MLSKRDTIEIFIFILERKKNLNTYVIAMIVSSVYGIVCIWYGIYNTIQVNVKQLFFELKFVLSSLKNKY